jgi:hypothetical protein
MLLPVVPPVEPLEGETESHVTEGVTTVKFVELGEELSVNVWGGTDCPTVPENDRDVGDSSTFTLVCAAAATVKDTGIVIEEGVPPATKIVTPEL